MRRMLRDGWRYERSDMLWVLALFAVCIGLFVAAVVWTALAWPDMDEHDRVITAFAWGWVLGGTGRRAEKRRR